MHKAGEKLLIAGRQYRLPDYRQIFLVGAGKAGAPMAQAASDILGERLAGGIVIVKEGYGTEQPGNRKVKILEAGHPFPDRRGLQATQEILALLANLHPDDLVICLISGGGSALMTAPAPGITLEDLQALTATLLACGAEINAINLLRKHLDLIKGGGLARLAAPAALATLILSDVVGNPLDVIASGPSVPDPTTFEQAYAVLVDNGILDQAPASVVTRLERGAQGKIPDTPKAGDPIFNQVQNVIVGSNQQAAQAGLERAQELGFHPLLLTTYLQGEARQAGRMLAAVARQVASNGQPVPRPACILAGGETTVSLQGDGVGGRNQELALGAAADIAGLAEVALFALATDGGDGLSKAAGAMVTGDTMRRARELELDPDDYLRRNDSYHFFEPLGDLLITGPTQTNVNDLAFLFAF
jgi:hydroxypyruvate reductase